MIKNRFDGRLVRGENSMSLANWKVRSELSNKFWMRLIQWVSSLGQQLQSSKLFRKGASPLSRPVRPQLAVGKRKCEAWELFFLKRENESLYHEARNKNVSLCKMLLLETPKDFRSLSERHTEGSLKGVQFETRANSSKKWKKLTKNKSQTLSSGEVEDDISVKLSFSTLIFTCTIESISGMKEIPLINMRGKHLIVSHRAGPRLVSEDHWDAFHLKPSDTLTVTWMMMAFPEIGQHCSVGDWQSVNTFEFPACR